MCDPHECTDYRCYCSDPICEWNELLNEIDNDNNSNESDCSSETFRCRNVIIEDERYLLNTDFLFSVVDEEVDGLRLDVASEELAI